MTNSDSDKATIEILAAIEHDRWARWHKHAVKNWSPENVQRWNRQADTSYTELSEPEKESDRREVASYYPKHLIERVKPIKDSGLDADLRSLGYDPVVVGKKGDVLARVCYEREILKNERDALLAEREELRKKVDELEKWGNTCLQQVDSYYQKLIKLESDKREILEALKNLSEKDLDDGEEGYCLLCMSLTWEHLKNCSLMVGRDIIKKHTPSVSETPEQSETPKSRGQDKEEKS